MQPKTPKVIADVSTEIKKNYLRGFWDADGGCPKHPEHSKLYMHFTQKDRSSLEDVKLFLDEIGINSGDIIVSDKSRNINRLVMTKKKSILKFIDTIGSAHPGKIVRFSRMRKLL